MCAKMGRPLSDNPKNEKINLRATKDDKELLQKCCELTGKNQYEIVMEGVRLVYENIKK